MDGLRPDSPLETPSDAGRTAWQDLSLEDPRVIQRLEDFAAALDQGKRPDKYALLIEFPQLSDELMGCLDTIELVCVSGHIWRFRHADGGACEG